MLDALSITFSHGTEYNSMTYHQGSIINFK